MGVVADATKTTMKKKVLIEALDDYINKVKGNIEYCQSGAESLDVPQKSREEFKRLLDEQRLRLEIAVDLRNEATEWKGGETTKCQQSN